MTQTANSHMARGLIMGTSTPGDSIPNIGSGGSRVNQPLKEPRQHQWQPPKPHGRGQPQLLGHQSAEQSQKERGPPAFAFSELEAAVSDQRQAASCQSPNQSEQIRRIHELVALYRCRFKQNASDAAVMGTLHSAASVIQIHFRYLRHLREAGLLPKRGKAKRPGDGGKLGEQVRVGKGRRPHEALQPDSNLYVDSDDDDAGFQAYLRKQRVPAKRGRQLQEETILERDSRQRWQAGPELDPESHSRTIKMSPEDDGLASDYINTTEKKTTKLDRTL